MQIESKTGDIDSGDLQSWPSEFNKLRVGIVTSLYGYVGWNIAFLALSKGLGKPVMQNVVFWQNPEFRPRPFEVHNVFCRDHTRTTSTSVLAKNWPSISHIWHRIRATEADIETMNIDAHCVLWRTPPSIWQLPPNRSRNTLKNTPTLLGHQHPHQINSVNQTDEYSATKQTSLTPPQTTKTVARHWRMTGRALRTRGRNIAKPTDHQDC